jgi:hypothetical protein
MMVGRGGGSGLNNEEFEEFVRRNPEEALRLIVKAFKPRELLKIGNRSYVNAFKYPESRFDPKDLIPDGGSLQVLKGDMLQPLRDPSKTFTDQVLIPPSQLVFQLAGKTYRKSGMPDDAGTVYGGLPDASTVIQEAINALPTIPDYTGNYNVKVSGAKFGSIFIKGYGYIIRSSITIPPGSVISIVGEARNMSSYLPNPVFDVPSDAVPLTVINIPFDSSNHPQSRVSIEKLTIKFEATNVNNVGIRNRSWYGRFKDIGINSPSSGGYGIYDDSGSINHVQIYDGIDLYNLSYGLYLDGQHGIVYDVAHIQCYYGVYVTDRGLRNGFIGNIGSVYSRYPIYCASSSDNPIYINSIFDEGVYSPSLPMVVTNGRRLIIGRYFYNHTSVTDPTTLFDNFSVVNVGIFGLLGVGYKLVRNGGTATFSGDGTTTTFNIAHGLAGTPKSWRVEAGSADAKGDKYVTADATYLYVTFATAPPSGTNNVVLVWQAEM